MKCILLFLSLAVYSFCSWGQGSKPSWISAENREVSYPHGSFFTGFSSKRISPRDVSKELTDRRKDAQHQLVESIRVRIKGEITTIEKSTKSKDTIDYYSKFEQKIQALVDETIVGIKTETYYDRSAHIAYAFSYVNKHELAGCYKGSLSAYTGQIESFVRTAQELERNGEKVRARRQLAAADSALEKVREAQNMLLSIDAHATAEDLQQAKIEQLHHVLSQMLARELQIYISDISSAIITNQLQAELAKIGYSFTDNAARADFSLRVQATVRPFSRFYGFLLCRADVVVELTEGDKVIYKDEFEQPGRALTPEQAERNALREAVPILVKKLEPWLK